MTARTRWEWAWRAVRRSAAETGDPWTAFAAVPPCRDPEEEIAFNDAIVDAIVAYEDRER